jgi:hypothetical protein
MADLKPQIRDIEQQFVDLYYGKYMADQWGITVGYKSFPGYWVNMRLQIATWQLAMDCTNLLCAKSKIGGTSVVTMASGTRDLNPEEPCCDPGARFQPL